MKPVCLFAVSLFTLALSAQGSSIEFIKPVVYNSGGEAPGSIVTGDVNGDGKPDLIVANYCPLPPISCNSISGVVAVLLGNGDGTFQAPVEYSSGGTQPDASSVAVGDLNGDGKLDIVVANYDSTSLGVLLGNGDGTFKPVAIYPISGGYYATSVAVADVNGDGKPDLIAAVACQTIDQNGYCANAYGQVAVLLGNGDGTFQAAVLYGSGGLLAQSLALKDLNGDGYLDLVVANRSSGTIGVLLGSGDGTFQTAVTYSSGGYIDPESVAIGDLNSDGKMDVVVASVCGTGGCDTGGIAVLLGNGDGTLQAPVNYSSGGHYASAVTIGDVNKDGHPDIVVANCSPSGSVCRGSGNVGVLIGNGDGTFHAPVTHRSGGRSAESVAIADVNGDGKPDILVINRCASGTCNNGTVGVLLNADLTATKVTSSLNPSQINQSVTFTAKITSTPPIPIGEVVTFYNGATKIGTSKTTNGIATLTTSFSTAGTYIIKAIYPGDAIHYRSSGSVKQVVNQ